MNKQVLTVIAILVSAMMSSCGDVDVPHEKANGYIDIALDIDRSGKTITISTTNNSDIAISEAFFNVWFNSDGVGRSKVGAFRVAGQRYNTGPSNDLEPGESETTTLPLNDAEMRELDDVFGISVHEEFITFSRNGATMHSPQSGYCRVRGLKLRISMPSDFLDTKKLENFLDTSQFLAMSPKDRSDHGSGQGEDGIIDSLIHDADSNGKSASYSRYLGFWDSLGASTGRGIGECK